MGNCDKFKEARTSLKRCKDYQYIAYHSIDTYIDVYIHTLLSYPTYSLSTQYSTKYSMMMMMMMMMENSKSGEDRI